MTKKIRKNTQHIIEITAVTTKGFGIGHIDGFLIFVDGGLPDDQLQIHIVKVKARYGYGKIIDIIKPSPSRIKSPCAVSDKCGGCQWEHCEYNAQLKFKKQIVIDALEKIGGITQNGIVQDVIGMATPQRYRNKSIFPVVSKENENISDSLMCTSFVIGMYAARSHRIVEVADCNIQHSAHVPILAKVSEYMQQNKITPYNETTHTGIMRHIMIRVGFSTNEIMVVLVTNMQKQKLLPHEETLIEMLSSVGATTVLVNSNQAKGNVILGEDFRLLSGSGYIHDNIGSVVYQISPPSFFQVNPIQTKMLYDIALKQANIEENGEEIVLDAHVGAGGVALYVAKNKKIKQVIGVDIVQAAIDDAKKNAALNGIENAQFICGAAEEIIPKLVSTNECDLPLKTCTPNIVFLDPPRKGCETILLNTLIEAKIKRIIYISCDPATLARDIKKLTDGGYKLIVAQPVDMFPMTGKVEVSCLLEI